MATTRPVKVTPPPLNVPIVGNGGMPSRALTDFLYRLWVRTGGNDDKPEIVRNRAVTAQSTAETGVSKAETGIRKAETAQGRADSAYSLAEAGQVPVGGIMPIAGGYDIPSNWALCDGANGTPDLRDQFIVAAGPTYPEGTSGGAGSDTVTTDPGGPGSTDSASASISTTTTAVASGTGTTVVTGVTAGGHSHPSADHTHGITVATVPPYYALALIMRTE